MIYQYPLWLYTMHFTLFTINRADRYLHEECKVLPLENADDIVRRLIKRPNLYKTFSILIEYASINHLLPLILDIAIVK